MLTLRERAIQARPATYDGRHDQRVRCHCGRVVSGCCEALDAAACPFDAPREPVRGRWGVRWEEGADA